MNNTVFVIFFVVFMGVLVGCGIYARRWVREASDFVLAGREVSTFINTTGVMAIGFAGTTIALAPSFGISYGFGNSLLWGCIYAFCGLALYGLLWSKFIRLNGAQTLPEYLEMRYSPKIRPIIAITSVIGMAGILANNIVSCQNAIVGYTGWNSYLVLAIIFVIIICFTFLSGLWAATLTDFFQIIVGVISVPTFLFLLVKQYGGIDAIAANWGVAGGTVYNWFSHGITGFTVPALKLTYPSVLNFVILFAAALVWGNNYYWMKIASCRSEKVARNSFVLAAIILTVLFSIPIGLIGMYAGAFKTESFTLAGGTVAPAAAYGFMARFFPPALGSLFVTGACAASISTASTSALGASAVASRDIYQRVINPKASTKQTLKASKVAMLIIGVITFFICLIPGGPTFIFAFANCWLIPPAILLMLGAIWPRFNNTGAFVGALSGMIFMVLFTILNDVLHVFNIGAYIYMATAGFLVTLVAALIGYCFGKPKYYGKPGWERVPTATNREEVKLDDRDLKVLELIRLGHLYQADITDTLGVDSSTAAVSVEKLDRGGYIVREGMTGIKFYTYSITQKGLEALPQLSGKEAEMCGEKLCPMYVELLNIVANDPEHQLDFVKKYDVKSMHMAAISSHLTRQGYIQEKGLFKRKLVVTEKGKAAVAKYA